MACDNTKQIGPHLMGGNAPTDSNDINFQTLTLFESQIQAAYPGLDCPTILSALQTIYGSGNLFIPPPSNHYSSVPDGFTLNRDDITWQLFDYASPGSGQGYITGAYNGNSVPITTFTFNWDSGGITGIDWETVPAVFIFGPGEWSELSISGFYGGVMRPESTYPTYACPSAVLSIPSLEAWLACLIPACGISPPTDPVAYNPSLGLRCANFSKVINPFGFQRK